MNDELEEVPERGAEEATTDEDGFQYIAWRTSSNRDDHGCGLAHDENHVLPAVEVAVESLLHGFCPDAPNAPKPGSTEANGAKASGQKRSHHEVEATRHTVFPGLKLDVKSADATSDGPTQERACNPNGRCNQHPTTLTEDFVDGATIGAGQYVSLPIRLEELPLLVRRAACRCGCDRRKQDHDDNVLGHEFRDVAKLLHCEDDARHRGIEGGRETACKPKRG
mmetsp:Transcript_15885/g.43517  ORF Transcript_15885/g.43517 Transcript_15885/m.43517 type:complete len:223 (+) Transcript_15885:1327-1995(+)